MHFAISVIFKRTESALHSSNENVPAGSAFFILGGVQSPTKINALRGHTLSSGQWLCADRNGV